MSFLIERKSIEDALTLLRSAGLSNCTSNTCRARAPTLEYDYTLSMGAVHFHLLWPEFRPIVQIHIRDERIWTLPQEDTTTFTDGSNIVWASDERFPRPNWGLPEGNNPNFGRCRHYPGSPVRVLTPEAYVDALVLLMVRDRNALSRLNWSTQINYLREYKFHDANKINPASRSYMVLTPETSLKESLVKATRSLGSVAEQGKRFAEWAK